MWERWNGDQMKNDPSMNSYNHYAYGAVADWIYRYAAGVDATPLDAGFHTVVLHPVFDARLGNVRFQLSVELWRDRVKLDTEGGGGGLECDDSSEHNGMAGTQCGERRPVQAGGNAIA